MIARALHPSPNEESRVPFSHPTPLRRLSVTRICNGCSLPAVRNLAEEFAISITFNGSSYAVLMATPDNLEDLAIGFSFSEGIVRGVEQIDAIETIVSDLGIEMRVWLAAACWDKLHRRRRYLAGPTGCGLCGIESLAEARREPQPVSSSIELTPEQIIEAIRALVPRQELNIATRAVHAAALWSPQEGLMLLREDVGRHNALDKLGGAMARAAVAPAGGALILTRRVSVEMVQKAAAFGFGVIVAMSAPTALAIRMAEAASITVIGIARDDGFEIFTHPDRVMKPVGF